MVKQSNNQAVKKIKDVADVALGQAVNSEAVTATQAEPELTGVTPNYREDSEGPVDNRAGVPKDLLGLIEVDPSEIILEQALRHPFGIYVIYGVVAFVVALVMGMVGAILINPQEFLGMGISAGSATVISMLALGVTIGAVVGGMLSAYVYGKSRMILTNQKVVLIQYHSLFSREVSQLNIGEVEDVNVSQPTIFDRLTKSGTITIETAGEQNNYRLTWMKDPYNFAKHTIQAHEGSIAEYGN